MASAHCAMVLPNSLIIKLTPHICDMKADFGYMFIFVDDSRLENTTKRPSL